MWSLARPSPQPSPSGRGRLSVLDSFEKRLELPGARGMPQLAERLGLDLTNTFAGNGEVLSNFFKGVLRARSAQAKAHLDDFLFARRKRGEYFVGDFA